MLELSIIHRAFLELIRISIGTSNNNFDFSVLSDDDWNKIIDESKNQAAILLCFDALKNVKQKPCDELYNKWLLMAMYKIKNNVLICREQDFLTNLLNDNKIPYIILKGASSACFYKDSDIRTLGDIDFLVDKADLAKTKELLINKGYRLDDETSSIHYEFNHNRVRVELHKTISGVPNNKYGTLFAIEILDFVEEGVLEKNFLRPCDYHHAIIILLHMLHHLLNNGIGIRHLCDWASFVQKTQNDTFWTERFIPLLKKTGTYKFMCGLTITSEKLLGINRPVWCTDVPDEMVETLFLEIFTSGNFGVKRKKKPSLIMTRMDSGKSSVFSKIQGMIYALNKTNHIVCPLIKKFPIIYPFLMIYRVIRYLILMCAGKKPSLAETSKYADERSSVFMKYELYKVEEDKNEQA